MSEDLILGLVSNLVTMVIASGGWWLAYRLQRNNRYVERLEKRIHRLEQEVLARIALERHVCAQIAEQEKSTERSVQLRLREELQQKTGMRPKLSLGDVAEHE
jgi:hypothetical protein